MKKFLIFGLLLPLAALAQNAESGHGKAIIADQSGAQAHDIPFAKTSPIRVPMNKVNDGKVHMDIGFVTTYDLQAATSVSRRIVLHKNGVVGATCTYSQKLNSWPDRGTAFNVYRDTNFLGTSHTTKRIESQRTGYPCITSIMDGGVERDLIVSHYASQTNADTSGGLFILENDSVGSDNFTETKITVPFGPLWPRVAASGDYVHIIANYFITGRASKDTVFRNGVRQPLVYYRYRISTKTFDIKGVALPGYASDRYASGSSDAYAIDAKDSTVAVVIGGTNSDIAFWKSNDNGNNWTKTVIDSFKKAPYDIIKDVDTFSQRTRCNDGAVDIIIDKKNNVNVFYGLMFTENTVAKDSSYSFFPGTDLIVYYNEKIKKLEGIGMSDTTQPLLNGNLNRTAGSPHTDAPNGAALYGDNGLSTWPTLSMDDSGYLYVIYSAPYRNQGSNVEIKGQDYRHIFCTVRGMNDSVWTPDADVSKNLLGNTDDLPKEDAFASVTRDADNNVYVLWMRDDEPGTALGNQDPDGQNQMVFASIPTATLKTLYLFNGIEGATKAPNFGLGACYPNPSRTSVNIPLSIVKGGEQVSLKVTDMLGREVYTSSYGTLPLGKNTLNVDVSTYGRGVYFYTVKVGNSSLTQKMIVN